MIIEFFLLIFMIIDKAFVSYIYSVFCLKRMNMFYAALSKAMTSDTRIIHTSSQSFRRQKILLRLGIPYPIS